jgi:hypothetical protein
MWRSSIGSSECHAALLSETSRIRLFPSHDPCVSVARFTVHLFVSMNRQFEAEPSIWSFSPTRRVPGNRALKFATVARIGVAPSLRS